MHKVSWPTWQQLQESAVVVLIGTIIIALLVLAMDLAWKELRVATPPLVDHRATVQAQDKQQMPWPTNLLTVPPFKCTHQFVKLEKLAAEMQHTYAPFFNTDFDFFGFSPLRKRSFECRMYTADVWLSCCVRSSKTGKYWKRVFSKTQASNIDLRKTHTFPCPTPVWPPFPCSFRDCHTRQTPLLPTGYQSTMHLCIENSNCWQVFGLQRHLLVHLFGETILFLLCPFVCLCNRSQVNTKKRITPTGTGLVYF